MFGGPIMGRRTRRGAERVLTSWWTVLNLWQIRLASVEAATPFAEAQGVPPVA